MAGRVRMCLFKVNKADIIVNTVYRRVPLQTNLELGGIWAAGSWIAI